MANSEACFLSHQLVSVALHGSSFHLAAVYINVTNIVSANISPRVQKEIIGFIGENVDKHQQYIDKIKNTKMQKITIYSNKLANIVINSANIAIYSKKSANIGIKSRKKNKCYRKIAR